MIDAGGTVLGGFLNTAGFSSLQNFLLICSSFPAFFYAFFSYRKLGLFLYFLFCLHSVFDVSYLTILERSCCIWQAYF